MTEGTPRNFDCDVTRMKILFQDKPLDNYASLFFSRRTWR